MNPLRETRLIFVHQMRNSLRNPVWIVMSLVQPVLYLALFGPLLGPITRVPGFPPGDQWQVFTPALVVMMVLFGTVFVGFGMISDYRAGVIERMRVTPASRVALLAGRSLRDVLTVMVQAALLTVVAMGFGLRAPVGGIVLGLVLLGLLGGAMSAVSYAVALLVKSEDSLAPLLNAFTVPALLLSGILLPMTLAPGWLYDLSRISPFTYVVDAERDLFRGQITTLAVLVGLLVTLALVALGAAWGTRTFQRESG
jgi:ABC-2 type transport system permease protein